MFNGAGPHSAATGGGSGSHSDWGSTAPSAAALIATPPSESTIARSLNGLDIQGVDGTPPPQPACVNSVAQQLNGHHIQGDNGTPSTPPAVSKKKKRGERAVGSDKNGRGLRQFSMRVCEKVESKGITTYNEVADELVTEFSNNNDNNDSPNGDSPSALEFDEKNIRRRVYDALNVLKAMEIISKDKKEIQWRGPPKTSMNDIEELKKEVIRRKERVERKNAYLKSLEEEYVCRKNLVQRNKQRYGSGEAPSSAVAFPFLLLKTRPEAHVEVDMSLDSQTVHFDFKSTPFEVHHENSIMKAMGLCGNKESDCIKAPVANGGECSITPSNYWHQSLQAPGPSGAWVPNSHPTPAILKGRGKREQK